MTEIIRTWKYKDSSRYWWEITLWKSGEHPSADAENWTDPSTVMDFEWCYRIKREEGGIINYQSSFVGQYELIPDIQDVLLDFLNYITSVMLGFAKWGEAEEKL